MHDTVAPKDNMPRPLFLQDFMGLDAAGLGLALVLASSTTAAAQPQAVRCDQRGAARLDGTPAPEGTRYRLAGDITLAAPATPAGWTLARCTSELALFVRTDEAHDAVLSALVSRATVAPWHDAASFTAEVRTMFQRANAPGPQHVTTDAITPTTVAGHPCVDLRRSGTATDQDKPERDAPDPLVTREVSRACHLRDPAHPGAAVLVIVKLSATKDPGTLGTTAQAFLAGVALPPPAPAQ